MDFFSPKYSICFATTFGATLKTVLDFSGVKTEKKKEVADALAEIADFFSPVSQQVQTMTGSDRQHLINGLATNKVSRRQAKLFQECSDPALKRTALYKSGHMNVALGATAAVIVGHYVMAVTGAKPSEVTENLTKCVDATQELLDSWNTSFFTSDPIYRDALGAEIRALERARAAASAAERVARDTKLDRLTALHLQLSYMRSAAWPAEAVVDEGDTHSNNVDRLRNGKSIRKQDLPKIVAPSLDALSLLNKSHSLWKSGKCDEEESESGFTTTASTTSSSSSSSSWSSASSVADFGKLNVTL